MERVVGHGFNDRSLLVAALTHRSFAHESVSPCQDNESLEFLGDAVLAFDIADRLFRQFPGLDEGRLSKHKHILVRASTLADAARALGLGDRIRLGRGEGRSGPVNDKILSNTFEALIAAIYLDAGLEPARAFIGRGLAATLESLDGSNPITDFKSTLQELTQARGLGTPSYRVVEETGPDHQKEFRVVVAIGVRDLATGVGSTKRAAHQIAARGAITNLSSDAPSG